MIIIHPLFSHLILDLLSECLTRVSNRALEVV